MHLLNLNFHVSTLRAIDRRTVHKHDDLVNLTFDGAPRLERLSYAVPCVYFVWSSYGGLLFATFSTFTVLASRDLVILNDLDFWILKLVHHFHVQMAFTLSSVLTLFFVVELKAVTWPTDWLTQKVQCVMWPSRGQGRIMTRGGARGLWPTESGDRSPPVRSSGKGPPR